MADEIRKSARVQPSHLAGTLWFGGWLFTIAYAGLLWWQALLGMIAWPYYLGAAFR